MNDHKKSVWDALEAFSRKDAKDKAPKKQRRANSKPEKEVERACLTWMREQKWDVQIFEAKATYNPRLGIYIQQSMKAGTADCLGCMPDGRMIAIEFKAPKRRRDFNKLSNYRQQQFIKNKIKQNAFACVVDSVDMLKTIYQIWSVIKDDIPAAKMLLEKMLP
jgi:hypothetical protein